MYTLMRKYDSLECFNKLQIFAEKHKNCRPHQQTKKSHDQVKELRTNNCWEHVSNAFKHYLELNGMEDQLIFTFNPQKTESRNVLTKLSST